MTNDNATQPNVSAIVDAILDGYPGVEWYFDPEGDNSPEVLAEVILVSEAEESGAAADWMIDCGADLPWALWDEIRPEVLRLMIDAVGDEMRGL